MILLLLHTKEDILKNSIGDQPVLISIDFYEYLVVCPTEDRKIQRNKMRVSK